MLNLYLLRHGKASKSADSGEDYDRELNKKGTAQCNRIGFVMVNTDMKIDQLLSSAALRTRQTAGIVNHYIKVEQCEFFEDLYLANADKILKFISLQGKKPNLLYVGHNFGISDITEILTDTKVDMATGHLVQIQFSFNTWDKLGSAQGKIVNSIIPDVHSF